MTAGPNNFDGNIYNLRLWDSAMTAAQLEALSCDTVGSVLDWDNRHWSIPSSLAQTDASLSCSKYRGGGHTQSNTCCPSGGPAGGAVGQTGLWLSSLLLRCPL